MCKYIIKNTNYLKVPKAIWIDLERSVFRANKCL